MNERQCKQHMTRLARARQRVEDDLARYQASVKRRNQLVRNAKAAGIPAAKAYGAAGISQSTFSRQGGDSPADQ